jgi:hypothetical protein
MVTWSLLSHAIGVESWLLGTYEKMPPMRGPAMEDIPHIPPISPKAAGLLRSGTARVSLYSREFIRIWIDSSIYSQTDLQQYAKITMAPENSPPTPMPAIARPTIRATLDGAVAQTKEL